MCSVGLIYLGYDKPRERGVGLVSVKQRLRHLAGVAAVSVEARVIRYIVFEGGMEACSAAFGVCSARDDCAGTAYERVWKDRQGADPLPRTWFR